MANTEASPITGKDFSQILELPPDTVINPSYPEEYRVILAEGLSLAHMIMKKPIPDTVISHLIESSRVNAEEVAQQAIAWNQAFEFEGLVDAIAQISTTNMLHTIRCTSTQVYSEVKEIQAFAAAQTISCAYALSLHS